MPYFHPVPHVHPSALAEAIKYIVTLTANNANQICQPLKDILLLQNAHSVAITILGLGLWAIASGKLN